MTSAAGLSPGRVCVLYSGGTIGARNLTPELYPGQLRMLDLSELPAELRQRGVEIDYTFRWLRDGPDSGATVSSAVGPGDWSALAERIAELYEDYDGFVVLHGTDTMAWTASALSFMLTNLGKPVVLTGSQRPIRASPSDALSNFAHALTLASRASDDTFLIPEVVICFNGRVLRGDRAQKVSTASLRGFASPNAPRLGRIGRKVDIAAGRLLPPPAPGAPLVVNSTVERRLADVTLFPGMRADQLEHSTAGAQGLVLRTYGAGNAPPDLTAVIERAVDRGTVVVNVTQCGEGVVESGMLSGNNTLAHLGVLSGVDLTPEAALTKLGVLLAQEERSVAMQQMQLDLRGEQSLDVIELRPVHPNRVGNFMQRFALSPALYARARPDRLLSAVVRIALDNPPNALSLNAYLNYWNLSPAVAEADGTPHQDLRTSRVPLHPSRKARLRRSQSPLMSPGAFGAPVTGRPVTVTLSSSKQMSYPSVVLPLFVKRDEGLS